MLENEVLIVIHSDGEFEWNKVHHEKMKHRGITMVVNKVHPNYSGGEFKLQ